VRLLSAAHAMSQGIGMVFQEQSLLPNLTIGENIYLGNEKQFVRFGIVDWRALYGAARRQLGKVQVDVDPRTRAGDLDFATRQMVELAKALTLEEQAKGNLVILLDEPTSVLEKDDIAILFERVRALKQRASFIFVSHRLDEVLALSDRVYVMKDGAVVADLKSSEADVSQLHHLMVGRGLRTEYYREPLQKPFGDEVVLEATGLTLAGAYRDVSFKLHAGEILGIAGVEGNGQTELVEAIAGLRPAAGSILLGGRDLAGASVRERGDAGLSHIPEDRHERGLILDYSVAENLILGQQHRFTRGATLDMDRVLAHARSLIAAYDIRPADPVLPARALSGGNQQKIVVAREMARDFRVLLAAQPTRGVDVGAIEFIHARLREARDQGKAVLLVSADLAEVLALADRVAVMYGGRFVAVLPRSEATPDAIGPLMTGAERAA
jgi:ribose transport system ATP-binding protein